MASLLDSYDVLTKILSLLPAKALGRLKTTNKRFRDVISDHDFVVSYARKSMQNVSGLLSWPCNSGGITAYFPMDNRPQEFPATSSGIQIKAASNGLLLCKKDNRYIIYNPTTKVTLHTVRNMVSELGLFGLVFNPFVSESTFKIVVGEHDSDFYEFTTYTPELGWGEPQKKLPCVRPGIDESVNSVFFSGTLHWLVYQRDIVAYNIDAGTARLLSLPNGQQSMKIFCYTSLLLCVSQGYMNLVKVEGGDIFLWVLEDYETVHWSKKQWIGRMEANSITKKVVPLFYDGNKCVLLRGDKTGRQCALSVYNIKERTWHEMGELEPWMSRYRTFVPYISHMYGRPDQYIQLHHDPQPEPVNSDSDDDMGFEVFND